MKLTYGSHDFPVAARKAIAAGEMFTFEIRGSSWELLRPHVVDNHVPNYAHLSAVPELGVAPLS
jgi:hypothetical protein